jgi:hypothetical protein
MTKYKFSNFEHMIKKLTLVYLLGIFTLLNAYSQCNNCTNTYTNSAAISATADNQTICITGGSSFTFLSAFKNVTVKICAANVTLTNVQIGTPALNNTIESFGDNTKISAIVSEADTFSFIAHNTGAAFTGSASLNGMSKFRTTNGATLTITPNLNPGKKIFFVAEEASTINTASITSNAGGQIIVGKHSKFNSTGTVILQNDGFLLNNGDFTANGDFTVQNGGNALTNFCGESTITINGKFIINNGALYNAGIIKATTIAVNAVAGPIYPNEGSQIIATGALETTNAANLFRGDSIKAGECALFKISSYGSWNAALSNSSKLKYCGPAATSSQLGQALADCNCLSEPKLCTPLCLPPTSVTITAPVNNVCTGASTVLTANTTGLKAGDTYTYSWYKTSVLPANLIVTNTNVNTLTVSTSGTYFVVVSNTIKPADCSTQNTAGFVFTVNPIPPQPTITASGPLTFCDGGSVNLTASTLGFTGGSYSWTKGSGVISTSNTLVATTSGTYTVTYMSASGCPAAASASVDVIVNPIPPKPNITAGGSLTFCDGGSVSLTALTLGFTGGSYSWTKGSGVISTSNTLVATTSGTYTVTYTSASGCQAVASASVDVIVNPIPPKPTITASGPLTFCAGGSVSLTASTTGFTGGSYSWTKGSGVISTSNTLVATTSGTYTVTYTSASGCPAVASASVDVIVNPIPPKPTITAGGPLTFCDGGSVSLTASITGFTGGSYSWTKGSGVISTSNTLVATTSGTYTVTYMSASGCPAAASASVDVIVNPIPPKPNITAGGSLTFCDGGSVSLTALTLGFTGGSYSWTKGSGVISTSNTLVATTSGTYTVTYTSASGCQAVASASVDVIVNPIPPKPTITASGPLTFCAGGSVSLTASTTGFTGGSYSWTKGSGVISTSNTLVATTSGTYTVTYTSASGCAAAASASVDVVVNPIPPKPTIAASGPLTFCAGGSVNLTASTLGFTGGNYSWTKGSGVISTSNTLVATTSGTYTVTYTSASGCAAAASASVDVVVNPIPPKPTIAASGPLTFCAGGSVNLTASTLGFTGGSYSWTKESGVISTSNTLLVTTSGTYTVTYTSASGCPAAASASVDVIVNPIPPKPTITASGPLTFCDGGSVSLNASIAGFAGGSYSWTKGNGVISTSNTLVVTTSGTYTVTYTSAVNCPASETASVEVVVNPIPPKPTITASGPLTFCDGGSVSLTASTAGFTGGSYSWTKGSGSISTSNTLLVTTSGTYTVTYTSASGCPAAASASVDVIVNPIPPKPTITASGPLTFCAGGSVSLTVEVNGFTGGNYSWSKGSGSISTSNTLIVTTSGTYTVTYSSASGCPAAASASVDVIVNPIPPKPTIAASGPLTFCDGGSVSLTASTTGFTGGSYSWTKESGVISTSNTLVATTSGTYTVTYTSASGCPAVASASVDVIVNPIPPKPTITADGPLTFCDGGSVSLTAVVDGFTGGSYSWSKGSGSISTSNILIVTTSGTYTVTYTSPDNCLAIETASVDVIVNPIPPKPTITAGGPLVFCDGGSVSLVASTLGFTGGSYVWSDGSTSNTLVAITSGTYTVTYTSAVNCPASEAASVDVIVNPIPPKPTIETNGPLTFCDDGSVRLTASATGFTAGSYSWSRGSGSISTSNTLLVTTSGTYTVTYTSASGCPATTSASVDVIVNPIPPKPTIAASGPLTFCDGGSVSLVASTLGFTGGSYVWSDGSTSNTLVATTSGTYTVTYTSAVNCPASETASIDVVVNPIPPQPTIEANGPLTFCDGGSVRLTASATGFTAGSYSWSKGSGSISTSNTLVVTISGTYTVTYTSTENCPATASAFIDVVVNSIPPRPALVASGPLAFCPGNFVTMHAAVDGFAGTLEWFNGSSSLGMLSDIDVYDEGTYTVKFTSDANCASNESSTFSTSILPFNSPVALGKDIITCNSYVDLSAAVSSVGTGVWSVHNNTTTSFLSKTDSTHVRVGGLIAGNTYTFIYTVSGASCGDPQRDTISIRAGLEDFDITSVETPHDTLCVGVSRRVEVTASGGSGNFRYNWINASSHDTIKTTARYLDIVPANIETTYYVFVEDLSPSNIGCKTFQDTLSIAAVGKQVLMIPNLITPNDDGKNDEFRIVEKDNLSKKMFPAQSYVEIYNRWGQRVFEANNYEGDWKAMDASDGMYYYYLKTGCGNEEFKGWVQILGNRN